MITLENLIVVVVFDSLFIAFGNQILTVLLFILPKNKVK